MKTPWPVSDADLTVLDTHARLLSKNAGPADAAAQIVAETLRHAVFAIREYQRVDPAEERAAFDTYVAGAVAADGISPREAATWADKALAERRERFGGSR
jgi:hypothetical protein